MFGGHEVGSSQDCPFHRRLHRSKQLSNSEVGEFHLALRIDHEVRRFEIAVDHSKIVGMLKCRTYFNGNIDDAFPAYLFFTSELLLQILAIHIFHRVEQQPLFFAKSDKLNDIGVLQFQKGLDLSIKATAKALVLSHVGGNDFNRNRIV